MNRMRIAGAAALVLAASMVVATGASAEQPSTLDYRGSDTDDVSHPLGDEQRARRQAALEMQLVGKSDGGPVAEVARGQFVELERSDEDEIWTVLGEFGDLESPFGILQGGLPGPLHNEIPEPDRSVDNSTIWREDFSQNYYEDLLFSQEPGANSMANFYIENSSNRYTVNGQVTDWVQVPYRAAHYGRDYCGSIVCAQTWVFVQDSVNAWYQSQLDAGLTTDEIDVYLSRYDTWDRYDHDGDGNFDEPDGYIDHFQSVHAGVGQETGGGEYGADSIWSHRWYVQLTPIGGGGPTLDDGTVVPNGGAQIGGSKYWIGDYTIEPENGGVGVFAHEFAHDLGLPDLYDTAGNTCGSACENSTAFWTLMSSGSYGNDGTVDIGTKPTHMGAWEKLQLGWLDYEVAFQGESSTHKLGPASASTKQAQALITLLDDKMVVEQIGSPFAGEQFYYSGQGNDLDNLMYANLDLPPNATMTAQVDHDIEEDWDYAYLVVSDDDGASWTEVETNLSTTSDPNGQNFGFGITGSSGGWTELTADLSAWTGDTLVGFRYWTDVAAVEPGISLDEIAVTGAPVLGAEDGDPAITADPTDGFRETTGSEEAAYFHAYIAEYRTHRGYDDALRTGPYNFGFTDVQPDWVERFSYEDGLLISYWDESQSDNSTSAHPGEGLVLPVDAHPEPMYDAFGNPWRARIQGYDSTFGLDATSGLTLHNLSEPSEHPSLPAESTFNDLRSYWRSETETASVQVPAAGTAITVVNTSARGNFAQVKVAPVDSPDDTALGNGKGKK
ncbi:MAG TPA: immune inhibitor A domain-containing protein [Nitriliruptoraceae bacterium]|nr:immune inhibitor A domain-containing protein [Nitriliruptoraceae bacterium]